MSEFKQGDTIEVRYSGSTKWMEREFLAEDSNGYFCKSVSDTRTVNMWSYARAITKPKLIPYTFDTFPKYKEIWLKDNDTQSTILVLEVASEYVGVNGSIIKFAGLLKHWIMTEDNGKTWHECGVTK